MSRKNKSLFNGISHLPCCGVDPNWRFMCKDDLELIKKMDLLNKLTVHKGCVNTIKWNNKGSFLLSGSDDRCLVITEPFKQKVLWRHKTIHKANIFSAKLLPDGSDSQIVSCSGDGMILHTDVNDPESTSKNQFNCHFGAVYEVETCPTDPNCFITCGEDGTVRWVDLRTQTSCNRKQCQENILLSCNPGVTALTCNKLKPYQLCIGNADGTIRLLDRRLVKEPSTSGGVKGIQSVFAFLIPEFYEKYQRITSVSFSPESEKQTLLVSYSSEDLYLFNIDDQSVKKLISNTSVTPMSPRKALNGQHQIPKIRMRGDWSDTGPGARPERESGEDEMDEARSLMRRITNVLARLLDDPLTRAAFYQRNDPHPISNDITQFNPTNRIQNNAERKGLKKGPDSSPDDEIIVYSMPYSMKFMGHRNVRTMIKEATFWGSQYVLSGSDCGHVFIWNKENGKLVMLLQGDQHVVNCLQPHPTMPFLATSGIDHDIKLWAPINDQTAFDEVNAENLILRNAQMLVQTRDTITVPASFMIRMIARINQRRRTQQQEQLRQDGNTAE